MIAEVVDRPERGYTIMHWPTGDHTEQTWIRSNVVIDVMENR